MTIERFELQALPLITAITLALLAVGCGEPPVGAPCLPEKVPEDGFSASESYIESSSVQCETRVCMVYKLRGDPNPDTCNPEGSCTDPETSNECFQQQCVPDSMRRDRVYCTCRCKAEAGFAECECPDGFKCEELLEGGGPGVKGSYCVRSKTIN